MHMESTNAAGVAQDVSLTSIKDLFGDIPEAPEDLFGDIPPAVKVQPKAPPKPRLTAEREELKTFFKALFPAKLPEKLDRKTTFLSTRVFEDSADGPPVYIEGFAPYRPGETLDSAIDHLMTGANKAARYHRPAVFCPPLALFSSDKKASRETLVCAPVLTVDHDEDSGRLDRLFDLIGTPAVVVESGGVFRSPEGREKAKRHAHWKLSVPATTQEEFAKLTCARALAAAIVGADPTSNSPVHPIRWPGSWHRKKAPRLACIVHCEPTYQIDLDTALARLEEEADRMGLNVQSRSSSSETGARAPSSIYQTDSEAIEALVSGTNYHQSLRDLAWRFAYDRIPQERIVGLLQGLMDAVPTKVRDMKGGAVHPGRWQARYDAIPALVQSALENNPHRRGTTADEDFEDLSELFEKARGRIYHVHPSEIRLDFNAPYLVEGLIDPGAMSVLYGDSNSGKTFVALSLAYAVATGTRWNGKRTKPGVVVYVAAEGGKSVEQRVEGLCVHHGRRDFPLLTVPCPVDLLDPKKVDLKALLADIAKAQSDYGPVKLIVLDTLSRVLAGGNENAPEDMGALVKNMDILRNKTGAHVMVVHHSGKDQSKGARGHSLLRAATDTEIEVRSDGTIRKLAVTKQRDKAYGGDVLFDLTGVHLGVNAEGGAVNTCVATFLDADTTVEVANSDRAAYAFECFKIALGRTGKISRQGQPYIETKAWKAVLISGEVGETPFPGADKPAALDKAFQRARDTLSRSGVLLELRKNQWVIVKADIADTTGH